MNNDAMIYTIREALPVDTVRLCTLLSQIELVTDGVLVTGTRYWVAEDSTGNVIGVGGAEYGKDAVLLRSAAVHPDCRGLGIGTKLVQCVFDASQQLGIRHVYCFSTDAGEYWQRLGFREVPVDELVEELPAAPQVLHFARIGWLPTEIAWRKDL
jgi:N-acetylglutamate synthase-like GNAT family acetyltransferase